MKTVVGSPSYIHITGINLGFQAGIQATDLVLIFTNDGAVRSLLRGKLTLNADAAGAVGRKAQVGVPILVNSGIYTFSRSKGVFAGVSLDGATITIADTSNQRVYGKYITGTDILMHRRVEPNDVVASFLNALATYSPGRPGEAETAQQNTTPPEADTPPEAETVAGTQQ
jgi:lipid-binding SYLF domain-containing protein